MLPLELGIRVDEFMISVIPLKTKIVLFLERPPWVKFGYSLVNAFLTRAMKKRVLMVPSTNTEEWVENVVGAECIPTEFDGLNGTLALDPFDISSRIQSSNMPDASK
jgi:CRAL/TRIO domain